MNLLCSAIQDNDLEPHSKQFSEQLLNLTLAFLTRQLEEIFVHTEGKSTPAGSWPGMCHHFSE